MKSICTICLVVACIVGIAPTVLHAAAKTDVTGTTSIKEWEFKRDPNQKSFGDDVFDRGPEEGEDTFKLYLVRNNKLYEDKTWRWGDQASTKLIVDFGRATRVQNDERRIWEYFAAIAGKDFIQKNMRYYQTYRNETVSMLAFVQYLDEKKSRPSWMLAVNANNARFDDRSWVRDMQTTLLHEYAHVLTLNKSQIKHKLLTNFSPIVDRKFCVGQYRSVYGCPLKKSYLKAFTDRFWTKTEIAAYVERRSLTKGRLDAMKTYYKENADSFVTLYAVKAPEEDIAESFVDFVITAKPVDTATKKSKKIAFFYEYPELVKMRTELRAKLKPYYVR